MKTIAELCAPVSAQRPRAPDPEVAAVAIRIASRMRQEGIRRKAIRDALRAGLGVEDIHVKLGYPEKYIRDRIAAWRKQGRLRELYE